MKVLFGAATAAVLLLASPAFAQDALSANCTGFEAAPTLPDGANATRGQIEAANAQVDAWQNARAQKQAACQADINALRAQLDAMISAYNTAGQERVAVVNAWGAEVEEFNSRGNRRRERGGTFMRPNNE